MSKKIALGVTLTILVLSTIGFFYFRFQDKSASQIIKEISDAPSKITSNSKDIPFKELTIPYLRSRDYRSSLGELIEYSDNASYTSYLTSFDSDGFKINGLLTRPKGEEPGDGWPAIVFVHGYIPPGSYSTTNQYADYVDYLASNGFVVFKIDLRGHGESEGEAGGGYFGSDYVIDTLNARQALLSTDFVKPNGVGLWGHSMAGNIVMRSFAVKPEIPGIVIWAGAVYTYEDMREFGISDSSYQPPAASSQRASRRQELFNRVGSPSADSEFWSLVAPTNYLNVLKGAIEIHHALDDSVVSINYSRNLIRLLDKTNVSHKLFEYSSGGHNIMGNSFNLAMQRTVDFFNKSL